jgi:hypothetical protein
MRPFKLSAAAGAGEEPLNVISWCQYLEVHISKTCGDLWQVRACM